MGEKNGQEPVLKVRSQMIDDKYIKGLSSFFKAIGEETRVKIIYGLSISEMCVNELSEALDISQSSVSHQLKLLKMEGQVKARRDGKKIYYSLDDQHVVDILEQSLKHIKHKMTDRQQ